MTACVLPPVIALAIAGCGAGSVTTSTLAGTSVIHSRSGVVRQGRPRAIESTTGRQTYALPKGRPQVVEPTAGDQSSAVPQGRPQVIEPTAGVETGGQGVAAAPSDPVGDPNAHAQPLSEVRAELRLELVAATISNATYIDPLRYVSVWERTDQGVDAQMPVGAPILAPTRVKVLATIQNWYAGQPLVYFELLDGPDAGKVQYVAEEITDIVPGGTILQQGQPIARYAASGTGIEYGWSTLNGVTLAVATTGYEEGSITPAGRSMRAWLNSLGANAGPDF